VIVSHENSPVLSGSGLSETTEGAMRKIPRDLVGLRVALELLFFFLGSSLAGAALLVGVGLVLGPRSLQPVVPSRVVDIVPLLMTIIYMRCRGITWHATEAVKSDLRRVISVSLLASIFAALLYAVIFSSVSGEYTIGRSSRSVELLRHHSGYDYREGINAFVLLLPVPILEEMIFRGGAMSALKRTVRRGTAVLLSAMLFAVAHLEPDQMTGAFLVGLLSGTAFLAAGRLLPSILVHVAWNATLMLWTLKDPLFPGLARIDHASIQWVALPAAIGVLISTRLLYHLAWAPDASCREPPPNS